MKILLLMCIFISGCSIKDDWKYPGFVYYFPQSNVSYKIIPSYIDHENKCVGKNASIPIMQYDEVTEKLKYENVEVYLIYINNGKQKNEQFSFCKEINHN